MSGLVLLAGALFAWRIHSALNKLEDYATKMGEGERFLSRHFVSFMSTAR